MTLFPDAQPLVSCIMPTHNRRLFVPKAIEYFLYQDYPNRELIIINDGTEPVSDLIPDNPNIHYLYQNQRHSVGAKRNIACKNANGEIIIHWDDDDWMADWRISYQVKNLLAREADICGLSRLFFFNPAANHGWEYINQDNKKPWVAGGTLCYMKYLWKQNPFSDINIGEGTRFV
jgi:glycosyltransferase involved in cell wall biosynthesis